MRSYPRNWTELNIRLRAATEGEARLLLRRERRGRRRRAWMRRIHSRLTTLRRDRERGELGIAEDRRSTRGGYCRACLIREMGAGGAETFIAEHRLRPVDLSDCCLICLAEDQP